MLFKYGKHQKLDKTNFLHKWNQHWKQLILWPLAGLVLITLTTNVSTNFATANSLDPSTKSISAALENRSNNKPSNVYSLIQNNWNQEKTKEVKPTTDGAISIISCTPENIANDIIDTVNNKNNYDLEVNSVKKAITNEQQNVNKVEVSRMNGALGHSSVTENFIEKIGETARATGQQYDLFPSVMLAQAIIESASGTSGLAAKPNYNLFGIKGKWTDKDGNSHSVSMKTKEDDGTGKYYEISADFRAYNSINDSIEDYAKLLTSTEKNSYGNFYKGVLRSNAKTYQQACKALQGNYATSTSYAETLTKTIEEYNLTRYDEGYDYNIVGTIHDPSSKDADNAGNRSLNNIDYSRLFSNSLEINGQPKDTSFSVINEIYINSVGSSLAGTMEEQSYIGELVQMDQLRMGDLLFFETENLVQNIGMYLKGDKFIYVPLESNCAKIGSIKDVVPSFAKRILTFNDNIKDTTSSSEQAKDELNKMFEKSKDDTEQGMSK